VERKLLTARLRRKVLLSEQTQTFHFEFVVEGTDNFAFEAGQFVSMVATDPHGKQQTRAYSIASAPSGNVFDVCANRVEGGFFSNLLADLPEGDGVQFHGPHGLFTLRKPLVDAIFIATGTGIAPMRGFVQWLFPENAPPLLPKHTRVWLVYGTRHETEIYYRNYFEKTASEHPNFHYLSTLSRPHDGWPGLSGYVQHHVPKVLEHRAQLEKKEPAPIVPVIGEGARVVSNQPDSRIPSTDSFPIHAYICGLNDMVSAIRDQLKEIGWERKQIIFERYD
jgi:ferredoxin-NADP reductase